MTLDQQSALDRIDNDVELYHEICAIFREDAPGILSSLKDALAGGEIVTATRHAHSLKSSAANIGAEYLSETARLTESALRSGNSEEIARLVQLLDQKLSDVNHALSEILN